MSAHKEEQKSWRRNVAAFEKSDLKYSIRQLINTGLPFLALWYLAYLSLSVSYWLTLALTIPAAGFLIRIFIIFHDCCHGSFFKSKKANAIVGTVTGILTSCPYYQWRYTHNVHHATNSNLNRRGVGDVWTLTVDEYLSSSWPRRLMYRLYRNPFILFGLGPILVFLIEYRFNRKNAGLKERLNTYITNLGIVGIAGLLCWLFGWQHFVMIQGPIFLISGMLGIWLFYVQHQFEDSYFEHEEDWDYIKAALQGSSFYNLPKVLNWITGNIGYHHVHHLSPRVPNYYLQRAHNGDPILQNVPSVNLLSSLTSLRHRLWDEQTKNFVGFGQIKRLVANRN